MPYDFSGLLKNFLSAFPLDVFEKLLIIPCLVLRRKIRSCVQAGKSRPMQVEG